MGQEYFINSQALEDKIRESLPSQGGAGAGFDLSASTQIIPVIDVTETAEGSVLRQDLQTSFSHNSLTFTQTINTANTIINNTGYFRLFGSMTNLPVDDIGICKIELSDGATQKTIIDSHVDKAYSGVGVSGSQFFDIIVFLASGDSVICTTDASNLAINTSTRQIADITGTLVNPT